MIISIEDVLNSPPTENQMSFIRNIEHNGGPEFTGKTALEASEYIKENKWHCEHAYIPRSGSGYYDYDGYVDDCYDACYYSAWYG